MAADYELLVFDFDGTLVDTAPGIHEGVNRALKRLGHAPRTLDEVKGAIGHGVHELFRDLMGPVESGALEKAVDSFRDWYGRNPVYETRAYPAVMDVLSGPLAGVKKAVVTNKPDVLVKIILDRLEMAHLFDAVLGTGAGHAPKPDPAGVFHVARELGVPPEQSIIIGDSSIDLETARRAGTAFAWVTYGYEVLPANGKYPVFSSAGEWVKFRKNP